MYYSIGNRKIGKDTLIFNMNSATHCPSKQLGLCEVSEKCYAMKAERMYPQVLPFRKKQALYWVNHTAVAIADELYTVCREKKLKLIRVSESGDFRTQDDVEKLKFVALLLEPFGIKLYGYTARKDLKFSRLPANLIMNGSNKMIDNRFEAVKDISDKKIKCKMNCRICNLCKVKGKKHIYVKMH